MLQLIHPAQAQESQGKPNSFLETSRLLREPISLCLHLGVWMGEETCIRLRNSARAPFLLVGVPLRIQPNSTSSGASLGLLRQVVPDMGSSQPAADLGSRFSFLQQKLNIQKTNTQEKTSLVSLLTSSCSFFQALGTRSYARLRSCVSER